MLTFTNAYKRHSASMSQHIHIWGKMADDNVNNDFLNQKVG